MSTNKTIQTEATGGSKKMLIAMVGIGVFCALMIVLTYEGTKERIDTLKAEALEKAVFNVLPGITKTRIYELTAEGTFVPSDGLDRTKTVVYAGFDEKDNFKGVAIEASGQGYADVIRILYGYDPSTQTVVGFYVLESKETPGLGDKIEKEENFLANFKALAVQLNADLTQLENKVIPVKQGGKTQPWEVEGITGATISSRTIGNILGESTATMVPLIYHQRDSFKVNTD
ncbi:electron transport complex protein RnfG [Aquiflexum balticum DSM 16537]|uniref:Ion-translocating oxidoreductase complex subunit G n=1 Tax=Aquiflexum balticum DSM 16537 TaxID=758820 RepID=A0A1W2H020_9BACT|nr:FMN-binding protein [Aquiflexum balticum]SMD42287.1 electron transport complex protein RnfG [Aquiflexum balticum DSM 16537]